MLLGITIPEKPQQNGVAERHNCASTEMMLLLLCDENKIKMARKLGKKQKENKIR